MEERDIMEKLNSEQQKAVAATEGPVLILAGAGSGKTRVLVHRIAYLIDVLGVSPGSILAITFTNKAADEMRSRVDSIVGFGSKEVWVSTFHSLCVRILRRYADLIGYTRYFSIYDTDDQLTLMKNLFKQRGTDPKRMREKAVLARISSAKDELIGPAKYRELNRDQFGQEIAGLYEAYNTRLKESNAMDFDDLILKTVELFEQHPEVLDVYQERFRYLMVDEYQDTNTAQFRFVSLLAGKYRNLCVVGDDDQSIYKFRGANIRNILGFETIFPDAEVVRLEQNYRSTQNILNAAYEVIRHNHGRKSKKLWTENPVGTKVRLRRFANGFEEAEFICGEIMREVRAHTHACKDYAILYRTNAQSRLFEEKMLMANLPYRIVGGINFYSRKEVKDLLAYLKTIDNAVDDLQAMRIINIPKRGIGAATIGRIANYAESGGISFFEAACEADRIPGLGSAAVRKVTGFTDFIGVLRARAEGQKISEILKSVVEGTGYVEELRKEETEEAENRIGNIDELISKAVQYEEHASEPTLSGFLEEVALIADIDSLDDTDDRVLLMTLHSAKGLEFPVVYMAGMEEGLFPSGMSINAFNPEEEIEEERRLCYVGITRAKESLTMTSARERMLRGEITESRLSRFVREIPRELVDVGDEAVLRPAGRTLNLTGRGADGAMRNAILGKAESAGRPPYDRDGDRGTIRESLYVSPYKKAGTPGKTEPDFGVGDTVRHVKFGDGVVKEIKDGGKDYLVTVDFPAWGIKKMYASFAKLKRV